MLLKYKIGLLILSTCVVVGVGVGVGVAVSNNNSETKEDREFTIDHEANTFLKDGVPFRYVAGSFHYFRALPETWRSKFRTMRAAGLNVVDLYVQWSLHNPREGVYNFEGIGNIVGVIEAAIAEDLLVILRPGPYICAEIDNGGVPYWLFTKYPGIRLRTNDPDYIREVGIWYKQLLEPLVDYMYGNGGPIIMVQLENEYGASGLCDKPYLNFLKTETEKYTQDNALLFTVDRPYGDEMECGKVEGVFVTTDFGLSTDAEVDTHWQKLRTIQPTGPLVNTEFYTGWLTHWQEENARRDAQPLARTLDKMLSDGANVDFYMFFGGTNFGFWAGANDWGLGKYMADITSYDYDAPMDEAGDPTMKYTVFRDVIGKYLDLPPVTLPVRQPKMALPSTTARPIGTIFSAKGRDKLGVRGALRESPPTFEELNQNSGFVLYETTLPPFTRDPSELVINDLRDRAYVYVDEYFVGILSRENAIKSLPISSGLGTTLQILVENQGRINFQVADDYKGILGNVTLQKWEEPYYQELTGWTTTGYAFESYPDIDAYLAETATDAVYQLPRRGVLTEGPVVFHVKFNIDVTEILDTYFDTENWGKGFVYVNGFNIGRYWPLAGPQMTMYIPKELLIRGENVMVIVEYQKAPLDMVVRFTDTPRLD